MFTALDTHLPSLVETGFAPASMWTRRGVIQADDEALATRMAPC
jgi:hypothetical protein